jgi:PilZ domain
VNARRKKERAQARTSSRIRIQVPVFLRAADQAGSEFIELTKTLNISARGACITSSHLLRLGQTVHLTIPAPSASSSSLVPNETPPITARVRRQETLGDIRVFGLEFLRPLE